MDEIKKMFLGIDLKKEMRRATFKRNQCAAFGCHWISMASLYSVFPKWVCQEELERLQQCDRCGEGHPDNTSITNEYRPPGSKHALKKQNIKVLTLDEFWMKYFSKDGIREAEETEE